MIFSSLTLYISLCVLYFSWFILHSSLLAFYVQHGALYTVTVAVVNQICHNEKKLFHPTYICHADKKRKEMES